jgi:hypothetical protein
VIALAFSVAACGGGSGAPSLAAPTSAPTSASAPAAASNDADIAPIPYTAAQIRGASRAGRTIEYKVEQAGKPPVRRRIAMRAVTVDGADVVSQTLAESGAAVTAPELKHVAWEELRHHAAFPRAATKMHDETLTVAAGTFDCTVYEVVRDGALTTFYFAKTLPGPLVLYFTTKDGARVTTSTMLSNTIAK